VKGLPTLDVFVDNKVEFRGDNVWYNFDLFNLMLLKHTYGLVPRSSILMNRFGLIQEVLLKGKTMYC